MNDKKLVLKKELIYHINKYYSLNSGEKPELTDEEYDSLIEKFLDLGGTREELPLGEKGDFQHIYKVSSLGKVNTIEDLKKHMLNLAPGIIEPKFDGLTLVHYRETNKIITRGDGIFGKDITDMAIMIPSIKKIIEQVSIKDRYIIRGEGIISKANFDLINKDRVSKNLDIYKNARNAISGILQSDDVTNLKYIDFIAYNIMGSGMKETEQIKILKEAGYQVTGYYNYSIDNLDKAVSWIALFDKNSTPYDIDGLVIKTNKANSLKIFGETEHHPKNAIAYKFPPEGKWTKLNEVTWHIGRTGKVSPVGHFNSIDLLGSTTSKATLHNPSYIKLLDLKINDDIFVIKANDIIPKILKNKSNSNSSQILIPTVCPKCNSQLQYINKDLYCSNDLCSAKTIKKTVHLCNALDIKDISIKTIEKLYDLNLIKQPYEIFNLTVDDFMKLDGYSNKSSNNAYNNIQSKRFVPFDKFLYSCGIPLVGKTASKDIANYFGKFSKFLADLMNGGNDIKEIKNIGDLIINSLKKNIDLIKYYMLFITPIDVEKKQEVNLLNVVITGSLNNISRKEYVKQIGKLGCKVTTSVTNNTDYIICDNLTDKSTITIAYDPDFSFEAIDNSQLNLVGVSSKIKDAVTIDKPIITSETLKKIITYLSLN